MPARLQSFGENQARLEALRDDLIQARKDHSEAILVEHGELNVNPLSEPGALEVTRRIEEVEKQIYENKQRRNETVRDLMLGADLADYRDPHNAPRAVSLVEELAVRYSDDGGPSETYSGLNKRASDFEAMSVPLSEAWDAVRQKSDQIAELEASSQNEQLSDMALNRKRHAVEALKRDRAALLTTARDLQRDYDQDAAFFQDLEAASWIAAVTETFGPEVAHDALFNVWEAIKEGAISSGAIGSATGFFVGGPGGAALLGSGGAAVGGMAGGLTTLGAGLAISEQELAALPDLLREDPEAAIEMLHDIEQAQFVAAVARGLMGGISIGREVAYNPLQGLIGVVSESISD